MFLFCFSLSAAVRNRDFLLRMQLNCSSGFSGALSQGVKLTFFFGRHLAPKYFKVVANSKKLVAIMTHTQKKQFLPCHCTR